MPTLVLTGLLLTGCISYGPRAWRSDQHMDMLAECRSACDGRMVRYEPYTGSCECSASSQIRSYK